MFDGQGSMTVHPGWVPMPRSWLKRLLRRPYVFRKSLLYHCPRHEWPVPVVSGMDIRAHDFVCRTQPEQNDE